MKTADTPKWEAPSADFSFHGLDNMLCADEVPYGGNNVRKTARLFTWLNAPRHNGPKCVRELKIKEKIK